MSKEFSIFPFPSAFARSFNDMLNDFAAKSNAYDIACYKSETASDVTFMFDVPGVQKSDIDIGFSDNGQVLTVNATRKFDDTEVKMKAAVAVPEKADTTANIKCSLQDGVLTVAIPVKKASQPRKLTIA